VRVSDETAVMELVFFRAQPDYLNNILPLGARRVLSGRIERFNRKFGVQTSESRKQAAKNKKAAPAAVNTE